MTDDRFAELRVAPMGEPLSRTGTVRQGNHRRPHRGQLVDVMQECRGFDQAAIECAPNQSCP